MNKYYLNAIYPIFYLALLDIDVFLAQLQISVAYFCSIGLYFLV